MQLSLLELDQVLRGEDVDGIRLGFFAVQDVLCTQFRLTSEDSVRVVGVGASAGGLDALTQMFSAMPDGLGLAFVVVQ
ncbi:MAG: chemotaxis protein CheB, partial [Myxococcota bacterium]